MRNPDARADVVKVTSLVSFLWLPSACTRTTVIASSLLQQPGPKKFKLSKIQLIYKGKKFKVPPFTI